MRHDDDNPVASTGAEVIERCLAYQMSEHGFGSAIRAARDDYLLVGRGVPWVRYVPHIKAVPAAIDALAENENDDPPPVAELLDFEEVVTDYVHWSDFGHTDGRRWEDVRGVWRRVRLDREEVAKRFGEEWATRLAYDAQTIRSDTGQTDANQVDSTEPGDGLATIYECWDARKRQIVFVSKGQTAALKVVDDDPLGLPRFFPCSRPIYATLANEDLFPISDYRQYRTQIRQIHALTKRIDALTDAVRIVGVYDASVPELERLFSKQDNTLVPVTNWNALAGKGGLDGAISIVPLKDIAEALVLLHGERDKALNDSYQLTGISDLIRGDTQASETATAQNIKNNYITMRFDEKKREIDRCIVNTLSIMASIICRVFADQHIVQMSGMKLFPTEAALQAAQAQIAAASAPDPSPANAPMQPGQTPPPAPAPIPDELTMEMADRPSWEAVLAFIRNEPERRFLIDIEADSTIASDQQAQQQQAVQFMSAVGGFVKEATAAVQQTPELLPLMGKMLEWAVRQFPISRDLEGSISTAVADLEKAAKAKAGQPPQPDPEMAKIQGMLALQKADQEAKMQLEQQRMQNDQQLAQQKLQGDLQLRAQDMAHQHTTQPAQAHVATMTGAIADQQAHQLNGAQAALDAQAKQADIQAQSDTAVEIARINALAKIEAARITADPAADPDAEAQQEDAAA
ncbi:hypothetical protein [Novosphingobium sp.]|uniref:hypothetical protein n=1 Tax=Novosphingobium sp. TaxID=1874826 RepID=UPI003D10AAFF